MLYRLRQIWETLTTSLWFFPGSIAIVGALLAWVALNVRISINEAWWLYGGSLEAASNLLSSFLNSIITVAALAISITMVVLTLAAQQLGPRLIRNFVDNWRTQLSLGVFVAAIIYLVLVLRSLPAVQADHVPDLAVTIGTIFVILCTIFLLFHVHHLSRSIVSDHAIERVGSELDLAACRLLPENGESGEPVELIRETTGRTPFAIDLERSGYIQAVDHEALADAARDADAMIELKFRAGNFVVPGGEHIVLWRGELNEKLKKAIRETVFVGRERTAVQDLEYPIRQLVEIAMRALYVWDPYTCTAVLDQLSISLARIMDRGEPKRVWKDEDGAVRLLAQGATFESMVNEAFSQIRQSGTKFPAVLTHLAEVLEVLFLRAETNWQRQVIARQIRMLVMTARQSIADYEDLARLEAKVPSGWAWACENLVKHNSTIPPQAHR